MNQKFANLNGMGLSLAAFGERFETQTEVLEYWNGRPAIRLLDIENGELFATLSVNMPEVELQEGEFLAKTWGENESWIGQALASGLFSDTGRRIPTGHAEAQVWEVL